MKGMTIQYIKKTLTGYDDYENPVYTEVNENVDDVLVGEPSTEEKVSTFEMYGKHIVYTLGIPKGDTHDWTDAEMIIFGDRYRSVGFPQKGIDANIPLRWNQNVKVERYG